MHRDKGSPLRECHSRWVQVSGLISAEQSGTSQAQAREGAGWCAGTWLVRDSRFRRTALCRWQSSKATKPFAAPQLRLTHPAAPNTGAADAGAAAAAASEPPAGFAWACGCCCFCPRALAPSRLAPPKPGLGLGLGSGPTSSATRSSSPSSSTHFRGSLGGGQTGQPTGGGWALALKPCLVV